MERLGQGELFPPGPSNGDLLVLAELAGGGAAGAEYTVSRLRTPFGDALLTESAGRLLSLAFVDTPGPLSPAPGPLAGEVAAYLNHGTPPPQPWVATVRGTDFQRAVWRALLAIPAGRTTTYGALARRLGRPGGAQAVGRAVGANPLALLVPCHRVVGAGGALTGYRWGVTRKRVILAAEQ